MNYCPKCGYETKGMKFCPKCGFQLEEDIIVEAEKESAKPIDISDLRMALVQNKAEHYVPIFNSLDKVGGLSWNWCSFFFAPMWFAYRKMYLWCVLSYVITFAVAFSIAFSVGLATGDTSMETLSKVINIGMAVLFGLIGNVVYKKRVDKLIQEMPEEGAARDKFIKSKGGTSGIALFVAIVISTMMLVISFFLTLEA